MRLVAFAGLLAVGACTHMEEADLDSLPQVDPISFTAGLCERVANFARSVPPGGRKVIRLSQKGEGWSDATMFCGWSEKDTAGISLCDSWLHNSASEYFHANVNALNECLSVDPPVISSPSGAPDAEGATGRFNFRAIRGWPRDAEAEVEYSIPWSLPDGNLHRFVELRASRPAAEEAPFSR